MQIVKACGISPGALQHHFPTKLDLVADTAAYLLEESVLWFAKIKGDLTRSRAGFAEGLIRSWREQFAGEEYAALLEILIAARTDEDLKTRVTPALDEWRLAIEAELAALHPDGADRKKLEDISVNLTISRALMTGLLVHDSLLDDQDRIEKVLTAWVQVASDAGARNQR